MAHDAAFARPTFRGGRFDSGLGMPVDALPDLAAYAEILTDIAKSLFKQRNPDRRRVSRGFEERLQLRITSVEASSSQVAVLTRRVPDGQLPLRDEYDDARDLLAEAVAAVAEGRDLPTTFPTSALSKFSRLGQNLEPGEHIAFARFGGGEAVYDRAIRTRLVELGGRSYAARDEFVGYVADLNSQTGRFELRLVDGSAALGGEYGAHWEGLHSAQGSPPESGQRVRVHADAEFTSSGQPQRFLVIHEVTVLDTWEWAEARLAELGSIESGWFDGEHGEPIDERVFDAVGDFFTLLVERGAPPPHLFPTPEGGLQAEWRTASMTVSVEFEPHGGVVLHSLDVDSGEDEHGATDLANLSRAAEFAFRAMALSR